MFAPTRNHARALTGLPRAHGLKTGLGSLPEALTAFGGEGLWAEFSTPRGVVVATGATIDARSPRAPTLPAAT